MRPKYLFIRLLEACNANCFMCDFARSNDAYRLSLEELSDIIGQAKKMGVQYLRFTGGEPLVHKQLESMVEMATGAGIYTSVITNGALLPKKAEGLHNAGLTQVVVSIDGACAETHNGFRNTPGLFERCLEGLSAANELGVKVRVNTVAGPHNYEEMPALQSLLTELGVHQWELSALKLDQSFSYKDPDHVRSVCEGVYDTVGRKALQPMGKRFYGDSEIEQTLYFEQGIPPRPSPPECHLAGDVIYIDAKEGRGFGCSLLPHRTDSVSGVGTLMRQGGQWVLDIPEFHEHVVAFRNAGPNLCKGCSTTAAGYSDAVAQHSALEKWAF